MSGSGWEALTDVRDFLPNDQERSGDHPGFVGVVERPSRICGSSVGLPGCPGVVRRPSQMFGSDREALPDVR